MSQYNELIKNFERVRAYVREFYVYGFKSRGEYDKKSGRSYDDERRRVESWLGDHMSFVRTPEGKNVFISIDSRSISENPLYKALKSKSFTDGDITLHFILFDVLSDADKRLTLKEILEKIDREYLSSVANPITVDESTVRKKLKEYTDIGIVHTEKSGKRVLYRRGEDFTASEGLVEALKFFSETAPCGVVGSFILDKAPKSEGPFCFKHHYITAALESEVVGRLFCAMQNKCAVTVTNLSRRSDEPRKNRIIPLKIYIGAQNGRQHLIAYQPDFNCIKSFRIEYLSSVKIEEPTPRFDELRKTLDVMENNTWGVTFKRNKWGIDMLERVSFTVKIGPGEEHIARRLEREKRVGHVEKLDRTTYRFTADVYDTNEMIPWIRTFICRIVQLDFSNRTVENRFKKDLLDLYSAYGIDGEVEK